MQIIKKYTPSNYVETIDVIEKQSIQKSSHWFIRLCKISLRGGMGDVHWYTNRILFASFVLIWLEKMLKKNKIKINEFHLNFINLKLLNKIQLLNAMIDLREKQSFLI